MSTLADSRWPRIIALTGVVLAAAVPAAPEDATDKLIDQAVAAYAGAQGIEDRNARTAAFDEARRLFARANRRQSRNADLLANEGTAALQAERLGLAILAFRRALLVDPDQERASRNLVQARSLLPRWVPTPAPAGALDTLFFWRHTLSVPERRGAAAVAFLLAAILLAVGIRWRSAGARATAVLLGAAWILLLGSALVESRAGAAAPAVLTAAETVARAADSPNAPSRFPEPLPAGTEVDLLETHPGWRRIRLANGRTAWVRRGSVTLVRAGVRTGAGAGEP